MTTLSPINRQIIDGKFYWQPIQTRFVRTAKGETMVITVWETLFRLPNPGVTIPVEFVGSYREQFTHNGYCYEVRLACHDGGDSVTATYQTKEAAKLAIEEYAASLDMGGER